MSIENIETDVYYDLGLTPEDLSALDKFGVEWRGRNVHQIYDDFRIRIIQKAAFALQAIDQSNPARAALLKAKILNDLQDILADDDVGEEPPDISRQYDPISGTYSKIAIVEKSLWKRTKEIGKAIGKGVKKGFRKTVDWFDEHAGHGGGGGGGGNAVHIPILGGGAPPPNLSQQLPGSNVNPHPHFSPPPSPPKTHFAQPAPSTPSFSTLSHPHENVFPQNHSPSSPFTPSHPILPTSFAGTSSNQPLIDQLSHPSLVDLGDERPALPLEKQEAKGVKADETPTEKKGFLTYYFSSTVNEIWDGISKFVSSFYKAGEVIGAAGSDELAKKSEAARQKWEEDSQAAHKKVDEFYSTNGAPRYTTEGEQFRREHPGVEVAKLELPFLPPQAPVQQVSKWRWLTRLWSTEQKGVTGTEIDKVGIKALQGPNLKNAATESTEKFKSANAFLDPYKGKYLSEIEARVLLKEAGLPTFSRPTGIPEDYLVQISNKGGMKYVHPQNAHTSVRVMPGKPHSPNPIQQKPYVVQMKDGKIFDKNGNVVDRKAPEAHIPLDEFIYRE